LKAGTDGQVSAFYDKQINKIIQTDKEIDLGPIFEEPQIQMEEEIVENKDLGPFTPRVEVVEEGRSSVGQNPASMPVVIPEPEPRNEMVTEDRGQQTKYSSIQIDRVRSATIRVPIRVNGKMTKAVLDTGAEVTVIGSHLYFGLSEEQRPKLKKAVRNLVVAEAGKKMDTDGITTVDVQIGDHNFKWDMYVAPIGDNVLLGCDIVDEMNITINSKKGIQIDGNWINCDVERRTDDKIARVQLAENVTVPANSEIILPGKKIYPGNIDTIYSMLQPIVEDNRKIIVAQSLHDPFEKILPIRLVNLENHPVR